MTHPLSARLAATQTTLAAFQGRAFAWESCDCVTLAATHLLHLGRPVELTAGGAYRSQRGALKALKRAGFESLEAAVDGQGLRRIAPAAALPGDLVGLQGAGGMVALTVALPNGRMFGFSAALTAAILEPYKTPLMAWSID